MSESVSSLETTRDLGSDAPIDRRDVPAGRQFVVAIGIDRYESWPILHNAVRDAEVASRLFVELGFEPWSPPILDRAATGQVLRDMAADLRGLARADSLVVFFAGHGYTRRQTFEDGTYVDTGFLVPADAALPGGADAALVRVDTWLSDLARIPARHVLVVLDACHSGSALGEAERSRDLSGIALRIDRTRGVGGEGATVVERGLDALARRRSRRVITSALAGEVALDSGPVDGHSLFTGCLIEALQLRRPTAGPAATVTGSALAVDVQQRVRSYTRSSQIPDFGTFELDDRGELHIPLPPPAVTSRPLPPPAPPPARPGVWSAVRRIPILGDYLDGRAQPRAAADRGQLVTALAVVGIAGLVEARDAGAALFGPAVAFYLWLALPVAVAALAMYAVCARERDRPSGRRYRVWQPLRHGMKVAAVATAFVAIARGVAAAPFGAPDLVEGWLCQDGVPITRAAVRLVDAAGRVVAADNLSDDDGYIVVPREHRAWRPLALRVERDGCATETLMIDATAMTTCGGSAPRKTWEVPACRR